MSGKTFLLNTSRRVGDLSLLVGEWFVVAQAVNRIPLPWLCLFDGADLMPCQLTFVEPAPGGGTPKPPARKFSILNPSVSVRQAKANLAQARPVFERLAGDAQVGARRWQEAMDSLAELTLEYLTIDPTRCLLMAGPEAGAATYAAAFAGGTEGLAAKARLAGIDAGGNANASFEALDGGFLEAGRHLRRTRSAEESRALRAGLATLEPYRAAPAPAQPPENFWHDEHLLARGRRDVAVAIGPSMFMGLRRYYSVRLTNRSSRPLRVQAYAGFSRIENGNYVLATHTGQWFSAETFIKCYDAPANGWIAPGQTVAHLGQASGDQDEHLAFWCEDDTRARFIVAGAVGRSASGGLMNGEGWALGLDVDPLGPDGPLVQREIDRLVQSLVTWALGHFGRELTRDLDGLRWLDDTIEVMHHDPDRSQWSDLVPMFGAFVGEVIRGVKPRGEWVRYGEVLCVQPDAASFFPFQKVVKRLVAGREADTSILGMAVQDHPPHRPSLPSQVRPFPEDPEAQAALAQLRSGLAQRRRSMHPITLAGVAGAAPAWMKPDDGLSEAVDRQALLLAEGTVVWASLVQANQQLFKAGQADCPAQVIYSRGPEFDARPLELRAIAQRIFKLKGATPTDPAERAIAQRVTNEMDRTMGWPLPVELTARPVLSAAIMVWRKHLPAGVLSCATFPVLVHPDTKAVMMVPVEFWPVGLVQLWKLGKL